MMTIKEFRILHSTIIEQYQFIEFHLKGIYAKICGEEFLMGLENVEKCNISLLMKEIKRIEEEKQISIISDSVYDRLENIRLRRNFWCHNCYIDMVFDSKTDAPREKYVKPFMEDLNEAKRLRDILYQKKMELFHHIFE